MTTYTVIPYTYIFGIIFFSIAFTKFIQNRNLSFARTCAFTGASLLAYSSVPTLWFLINIPKEAITPRAELFMPLAFTYCIIGLIMAGAIVGAAIVIRKT